MKIMIINPNSSHDMTETIQKIAENYAQDRFEVLVQSIPTGPLFIENYEDQAAVALEMLSIVRQAENQYDAFVIACHCDPNLDLIKEATDRVVVGIGEASMKLASMLGHNFSVVSTDLHSVPNKEALIRRYHLENLCASVKAPSPDETFKNERDKIMHIAKRAIQEDNAEVIVLGCAGYAGLDKIISEAINAPVLDGVICALMIAEGLVRYGVSTSKVRRYKPVTFDLMNNN